MHRYAITYMQRKKSVGMLSSELMTIEGVGQSRYRALMDKFKTLENIKKASIDELAGTPGISRALAEKIYLYFKEERS